MAIADLARTTSKARYSPPIGLVKMEGADKDQAIYYQERHHNRSETRHKVMEDEEIALGGRQSRVREGVYERGCRR